MKKQPEDISAWLAEVETENAYLRRKLERLKTQQWRQEKIDEMNRYQSKRANSRLEEANAIAEQANKAKTEFLANISHEIRTPLNIVLGMGELLSETALNTLQKNYLHNLRLSGKHLLELINNIPDFLRIESGSVDDKGKGIPEEKQAIIFERFAQVEDSHLKNKSGVGLGLAITQRLVVTAMGGKINFKTSTKWGGGVFRFYLPLPIADTAAEKMNNNVSLTIVPERMQQLNVLVVDDVSLNIDMIDHFLQEYPLAIDRAENGLLAVELFKKNKYDLILMDIRMPVMYGSTAMQAIK